MFSKIEQNNFFAHYDPAKQIICLVVFNQSIPTGMFETLYRWIQELKNANQDVHTILMDFQHLRSFPKAKDSEHDNAIIAQFPESVKVPVVMIAANPYQQRKLDEYAQTLNNLSDYHIVQSYESAFDRIDTFHPLADIEQADFVLSTKQASMWFDIESGSLHIIYYGVVTAQSTADVYGQLFAIIEAVGVDAVHSAIFEFRHVNKFDNSNLQSVKRSSGTLNKSYDMNHIAVALVTGNFHQEQMVRLALKVSPQEERKKIVSSLDEAYQFIEQFLSGWEIEADSLK